MFGLILGSFVWFLDVLICLIVSFVTMSVFVFIGVAVYRYFDDSMKRFEEWVHHASEQRLTVTSMILVFLAIFVLCRSVYLTWWKQVDSESSKFTVTLLGSWLPFHLLQNYNIDVYPITIYVNKLYLVLCLLLFIPIYGVAVSKLSKTNKPFTRIGFWVTSQCSKFSRGDKNSGTKQCVYHEFSDEQFLKALFSSTVSYKEKEIEIEILKGEVHRLQKNSAKLHGQVKKERDENNDLKLKMAEQEKELSSKRPSVRDWQSVGDDCMCVICMERTRQFNLKPCNHFCVCNICKPTLQNRCPLCRKRVQRFERIYLNLE